MHFISEMNSTHIPDEPHDSCKKARDLLPLDRKRREGLDRVKDFVFGLCCY